LFSGVVVSCRNWIAILGEVVVVSAMAKNGSEVLAVVEAHFGFSQNEKEKSSDCTISNDKKDDDSIYVVKYEVYSEDLVL
jgi:hypothetical protein